MVVAIISFTSSIMARKANAPGKRETLWELATIGNYNLRALAQENTEKAAWKRPPPLPPKAHREGAAFGGFGPRVDMELLQQDRQALTRQYHDKWFKTSIARQRVEARRPPLHASECLTLGRKLWQSALDEEAGRVLKAREVLQNNMELEDDFAAIQDDYVREIAHIDRERLISSEEMKEEHRREMQMNQTWNSSHLARHAFAQQAVDKELQLQKDRIRHQSLTMSGTIGTSSDYNTSLSRGGWGLSSASQAQKAARTMPAGFRLGVGEEDEELRKKVPGSMRSPRMTYFKFGADGKETWKKHQSGRTNTGGDSPRRSGLQRLASGSAARGKQPEERIGSPH